jgi:hypothetical protein
MPMGLRQPAYFLHDISTAITRITGQPSGMTLPTIGRRPCRVEHVEFGAGDRLMFTRNNRYQERRNGMVATVMGVDPTRAQVTVAMPGGAPHRAGRAVRPTTPVPGTPWCTPRCSERSLLCLKPRHLLDRARPRIPDKHLIPLAFLARIMPATGATGS